MTTIASSGCPRVMASCESDGSPDPAPERADATASTAGRTASRCAAVDLRSLRHDRLTRSSNARNVRGGLHGLGRTTRGSKRAPWTGCTKNPTAAPATARTRSSAPAPARVLDPTPGTARGRRAAAPRRAAPPWSASSETRALRHPCRPGDVLEVGLLVPALAEDRLGTPQEPVTPVFARAPIAGRVKPAVRSDGHFCGHVDEPFVTTKRNNLHANYATVHHAHEMNGHFLLHYTKATMATSRPRSSTRRPPGARPAARPRHCRRRRLILVVLVLGLAAALAAAVGFGPGGRADSGRDRLRPDRDRAHARPLRWDRDGGDRVVARPRFRARRRSTTPSPPVVTDVDLDGDVDIDDYDGGDATFDFDGDGIDQTQLVDETIDLESMTAWSTSISPAISSHLDVARVRRSSVQRHRADDRAKLRLRSAC